jgi:hypothetical protein
MKLHRPHVDRIGAALLIVSCAFPALSIVLGLALSSLPNAPLLGLTVGGLGFIIGLCVTYVVMFLRGGPMHFAARTGQCRWLIELATRGHRVNARNGFGETPVELALRHGHVDCVLALIDMGLDSSDARFFSGEFWGRARDTLSATDFRLLVEHFNAVKHNRPCGSEKGKRKEDGPDLRPELGSDPDI